MKILYAAAEVLPDHDGVSSALLTLLRNGGKDFSADLWSFSGGGKYGVADDRLTAFGFSRNWKKRADALRKEDCDLIFIHGLWQYFALSAAKTARRLRIPYLVAPHGMLYPEALQIGAWKKRLCRKFGFDALLQNASAVVVSCEREAEVYRALGFRNPVAVIPNGIEIPEVPKVVKTQKIVFLGRLVPYKNALLLLQAWRDMADAPAELVIAGSGDCDYERKLKDFVRQNHLANVSFTGEVKGGEKTALLASAKALVLPSAFESFGLVALESLACGTPVIASLDTPWNDLTTYRCGWHVPLEKFPDAMHRALNQPPEELAGRRQNALALVREKYTADKTTQSLSALYRWIAGKGERPSFVRLFAENQSL
ncbi:MAG: glycosyltransferase [Victivallaceae bacterium]|nr:glycosyltransferase [Victivallaceae bacterium]